MALYLDHVLRRGPLRPLRAPGRLAREPARPRARPAASGAARRAARARSRPTTTSSRRSQRDAASSSPAAPGSSARTSSTRCSSAATTCACSTTSPPGSRANLAALGREVEIVEGDLRSYERVHTAVRGVERRLPPGRARLGAALGAGPAHVDRGQRRGHAQRPARGARRGRPARRRSPRRRRCTATAARSRASRRRRRTRSRPTPSRSSRPSGSASASRRVYGIETVALRYFNVFGPRQDPTSQYAAVVPRFIRAIADGPPVTIHGDGEQSRDFTYVENVVAANLLAADAAGAERPRAQRRDGRLRDRQRPRGHDRPPARQGRSRRRSGPARPGDVRVSWADISRRARDDRIRAGGGLRGRPAADDRQRCSTRREDDDGARVRHRSTSWARATGSGRCGRRWA